MKKKLILISSKAITVNIFLDQLIIDLKKILDHLCLCWRSTKYKSKM